MFEEYIGKLVKVVYEDGDRPDQVAKGDLIFVQDGFIRIRTLVKDITISVSKINKLEVPNNG